MLRDKTHRVQTTLELAVDYAGVIKKQRNRRAVGKQRLDCAEAARSAARVQKQLFGFDIAVVKHVSK